MMLIQQNSQTPQGASMHEESNATKSVTQEPPSKQTSSEKSLDDPFEFRDPNVWRSRIFESEDLIASKQWYQKNYDRKESQNCPVCQNLSVDLANLLSRANTFKFVTPIGALMMAFVGAYLAVLLKPDQSVITSVIIQGLIATVIGVTALITLIFYWMAQCDSEERTKVAFKLMEFSRMNEINTSPKDQKICSQHKRLVPSEQE